jgi:phosphoketolase
MKIMNTLLPGPEDPELLHRMDAYWRATNYLSVGQLYRYDNPLLKKPLELSHVKPLAVGPGGTTPGQNFSYVHLNGVIKKYDLDCSISLVPVTAARRWSAIPTSRAPTARSTRTSVRMKPGQYMAKQGRDMPETVNWTWGMS